VVLFITNHTSLALFPILLPFTSGFVDDVMFAHNWPVGHILSDSLAAAPGVKPDDYNCLAFLSTDNFFIAWRIGMMCLLIFSV